MPVASATSRRRRRARQRRVRVPCTEVRNHPQRPTPAGLGLRAARGARPSELRPVIRADPEDRHDGRSEAGDLGPERCGRATSASRPTSSARTCARHQTRDPDAAIDQVPTVNLRECRRGVHQPIDHTGPLEGRIEPVPAKGEMRLRGGAQPRIDADEQQPRRNVPRVLTAAPLGGCARLGPG